MPPAARARETISIDNFQGGLNVRANAFQLRNSETGDLLNIDLDPRGGFSLRRGVKPLHDAALPATPRNIWAYEPVALPAQVIVQVGNDFAHASAGSNFTVVDLGADTVDDRMRATVFADICYIQRNAQHNAVKWDGATSTVLGTTFVDDIAAPTGGNMPRAKCIATHMGSVFVANTHEGGTAHRSRVRWSHPNRPEDWRTLDFIDVDVGLDADEITALVPFQDRLLVFKHRSVYAIHGFPPESLFPAPISQSVGAVTQEAVTANGSEAYFFSWPEGVMRYDGKQVSWLFERLTPFIDERKIPAEFQHQITLAWLDERLWVGIPWGASTTNARVLVYDPTLRGEGIRRTASRRQTGGWMFHDLPLGPMLKWAPKGGQHKHLACRGEGPWVLELERQNQPFDVFAFDTSEPPEEIVTHIPSHYTTQWIDAGNPRQMKRWRRPEFVMLAESEVELTGQVFHDFDPSFIKRQFTVKVTPLSVGDALIWGPHDDAGKWDEAAWAQDAPGRQQLRKTSGLGRAQAVQLKINGPSTNTHWSVGNISLVFVGKRVR